MVGVVFFATVMITVIGTADVNTAVPAYFSKENAFSKYFIDGVCGLFFAEFVDDSVVSCYSEFPCFSCMCVCHISK